MLFSVPLRRSLIVEQGLAFPEGKAAAEVLKAGENPAQGVKILGGAALGGGLVKLAAASGLRLIPDTAAAAAYVGKGIAYIGTNLSPALLGVGYIVGLNIGIVVLVGGVISWNIAIPIYAAFFLDGNPELASAVAGLDAESAAGVLWSTQIRYLGVGAMLIGGIWTLFSLRKSLLSGIKSGLAATRAGTRTMIAHTERDLPMKGVLIGIVLFTLPLLVLYQSIVGSVRGERADDDHHDRRGLPVLLGLGVHGRPRRLVEQSGVGHHDRHDPVLGASCCSMLMGPNATTRPGRRDHDRRRGLLRGVHRRRQPAGPEVRLHRRRDAVAPAGDARDRRVRERARDGAGAEPARGGLRHRRADRRRIRTRCSRRRPR